MPRSWMVNRALLGVVAYMVVLAGVCVWTVFGGSLVVLIAVALPPALALLRTRLPLGASLALLLVVFAWTILVLFIVSRYTMIPPIVLVVTLAATVGALSVVRLATAGLPFTRSDAVDLGFAGTGGLLWCSVILAAAVLPGGTPVSWAMTGDAANNVLFARTLIEQGGVSVGIGQNPVPLTAAVIALFTLPAAVFGPPTVGSEITALAEMWSFGIVAACIMCGALALSLTRRRSALSLVAVGVSSLLPLGWFLLSGPILLGFVNFHLTIAVLVASLVGLLNANRAMLSSFVTISLSLGAVLALWAPLAGIPGTALLLVVILHGRRLLALRRGRLVIAVAALAQPLGLFFALSVPSVFGQGQALQESSGAVFEFKKVILVVLLALAVIFALSHVRATRSAGMGWVLIAVAGGGGVCLSALLWLRRDEANIWNYYQLKFLWFLMAMLLIIGVAAGLAFAASIVGRRSLAALSVLVVLVTASGVSEFGKATVPTFNRDAQALLSPISRILAGDFFSVGEDDRVFHRVVELMGSDEKKILWESSDPDEDSIMFWVVQMSAASVDDVDLRAYAYYHDGQSMDDLCSLRELMGPPVALITADAEIARRAEESCGELGPIRIEQ